MFVDPFPEEEISDYLAHGPAVRVPVVGYDIIKVSSIVICTARAVFIADSILMRM